MSGRNDDTETKDEYLPSQNFLKVTNNHIQKVALNSADRTVTHCWRAVNQGNYEIRRLHLTGQHNVHVQNVSSNNSYNAT